MKKYLLYLMIIIGSCFLLNNNVSALTISNQFNTVFDEEYIYNKFSEDENFDIDIYPYILCDWGTVNTYYRGLECRAFTEESYNILYLDSYISSGTYTVRLPKIGSEYGEVCHFEFYQNINTGSVYNDYVSCSGESFGWGLYIKGNDSTDSSTGKTYSNFNILTYDSDVTESTFNNFNTAINKLDFSEYLPEPTFDENLFANDENFKEVCVEKGKKYAITSTNIDPISNTLFVSDFFWFPGKVTGIKYSEYDSLNDNNILIFNDDISTENYYFENREKIDSFYNNDIISNYFNHSGYTDKYSYYGYTAYKFIHSYYVDDNSNPQNMFTIFDFTNINFIPFINNDNSTSNYCFYIKNEFNVTELKNDEWNDYTGTVPTPGGDLDVNTSYNKNNRDVNSKFLDVTNFLESMSGTIAFVNSYIFIFYSSMPLALRGFILTALIVLIIILIMKIGGYK